MAFSPVRPCCSACRERNAFKSLWRVWIFDSPRCCFEWTCATFSFAASLLLGLIAYEALPHIDDEVSALWQSQIFLSGQITLPPPPVPEAFQLATTIGPWTGSDTGQLVDWWCSMYPPGWSVLLMPFVALGVPWMLNPLLGAFLIVAIGWLGREIFGERVGRIACLLSLASPFLLLINGTHLTHTSTALTLTLCAAAVVRLLRDPHWAWGLLAGSTMLIAFLTRTFTATLFGFLLALYVFVHWRRALAAWKAVLAALLPTLAAVGLLMAYFSVITGDPTKTGHAFAMADIGIFGFGEHHSPTKAVRMTIDRLLHLNRLVIGWPIGLLALVLLPCCLGRACLKVPWLLLFPLSLLGTFALFWYWEYYWPARYVTAGVPMLLIVVAFGLVELAQAVRADSAALNRLPAWLGLSGLLFAVLVVIPAELQRFRPQFGDADQALLASIANLDQALVLVSSQGEAPDLPDPRNDYFALGWWQNGIEWQQAPVLCVRDLGERNAEILAAFPDRQPYRYMLNRSTMMSTLELIKE